MMPKTNESNRIFALHRYFIWSARMMGDFEVAFRQGEFLPAPGESALATPMKFMVLSVGTYMSYWYASLYVVCEGWQELGLADPKIDALLGHPNLQLLRRYRNGAFHFQAGYFDDRFSGFQSEQGSVQWIRDLMSAFDVWFRAQVPQHIDRRKRRLTSRVWTTPTSSTVGDITRNMNLNSRFNARPPQ